MHFLWLLSCPVPSTSSYGSTVGQRRISRRYADHCQRMEKRTVVAFYPGDAGRHRNNTIGEHMKKVLSSVLAVAVASATFGVFAQPSTKSTETTVEKSNTVQTPKPDT